jgi:hypothetical protein
MATQFSRQNVVDILRKTGFNEAADEAERVLPDSVDFDQVAEWAQQHGITHDMLISAMGGSS